MNKRISFTFLAGLIVILLMLTACQVRSSAEVATVADGKVGVVSAKAATLEDRLKVASQTTGPTSLGSDAALLAGVPEPADAAFRAQDIIQEGGRHFFFTSTAAPADIVESYQAALEAAGWTVEDVGGGGDPFGLFASGAGLTATNESRYLKMNAGGPNGRTYIDICVWPQEPNDNNCGQDNNNQDQMASGDARLGANADLLTGIPEVPNSTFRNEDAIQEGGRHFFYTSNAPPAAIMDDYQQALEAAGWTIEDSGSGGDPFGLFGGGANLTATNDSRYLKFNAGGPTGSTFVDVCVWSSQPDDDNCGQNNNNNNQSDSAFFGASADLLVGIPEPANADFQAQNSIWEGGRHFWYTSSGDPLGIVGNYQEALEAAGWDIESSGGGGDPFGLFGSGAGLTATNDSRYLKVNAGGPRGETYMDICVWPSEPSDNGCDEDAYAKTSGASTTLGADASLITDVPDIDNAEFQAEDAIHENGRHFFYTTASSPANIVSAYESALEDAGWRILDSGGDPFGVFGAGLTASDGTRYLKFNAGGPGAGTTFIDACIWPTRPSDDQCDQPNQSSGSGNLGVARGLTADVPEPADAEFESQNSTHEGGRHFYYTSSEPYEDVVSAYQEALETNGWTIESSGGGGDPFGVFGGGGGVTATNGARYLKINAGGPTGAKTNIDICVWPTEPNDNNCDQDSNRTTSGARTLGASDNLLAGVPELAEVTDAEFKNEDAIQEGGRHYFFVSSSGPSDVVDNYLTALEEAGWEILDSGGGGDPFGFFGGGAGLTATDGTRIVKLNAGGPAGTTFIDACIWPSAPVDDNCGQNDNNN